MYLPRRLHHPTSPYPTPQHPARLRGLRRTRSRGSWSRPCAASADPPAASCAGPSGAQRSGCSVAVAESSHPLRGWKGGGKLLFLGEYSLYQVVGRDDFEVEQHVSQGWSLEEGPSIRATQGLSIVSRPKHTRPNRTNQCGFLIPG